MSKRWNSQFTMTALLAVAVVACGGDGGSWTGTVTDSAGVQIVLNPQEGVWSAQERPGIEEELKIGNASGDPNYQFGQIGGLDVGSDGTIYVLDQQAMAVRAYDADGLYLRTIGRPGSGPGELGQAVAGVIVTPGDTLLVPDVGQQRVTRFTSDGEVIGSFPIPLLEGILRIPVRWAARSDGRIVQQLRLMNAPGQEATVEPKDLLLLLDAAGVLLDTVMVLPIGQTLQMSQSEMRVRLFDPEPLWGLGSDGTIYFAMNSDYSIAAHTADGQLQRIIRRDVQRKPVTEADKAGFMKVLRELLQRQQGEASEAVEMVLANTSFADNYPAFATLIGGPGGSLWVQRIQSASDMIEAGAEFNPLDLGSPVWDIFGTDGRYLGEIRLPERFTPLRVLENRIYGIWRDELDVQYVSRIRVEGEITPMTVEGQVGG